MPHDAQPSPTQAAGVSPSLSIDTSLPTPSLPTSSRSLALDAESSLQSQRSRADTQPTSLPSRPTSPPTLVEDAYASIQVELTEVTPRAFHEAEVRRFEGLLEELNRQQAEIAEKKERLLLELSDARLRRDEDEGDATDLPPASYYAKQDLPWRFEVRRTAKRLGIDKLRPAQETIINVMVHRKHNLLAPLPTGFGKSACFQTPALLGGQKGLTLVVQPYCALMNDQMIEYERRGFDEQARCLHLDTPKAERKAIMEDIRSKDGRIRILMIAPERLAMAAFRHALRQCHANGRLKQFVVDEIHCMITQASFRPDYAKLPFYLGQFPDIPCAGFSATLTDDMIAQIVREAPCFRSALVFRAPVTRHNLSYSIYLKPLRKCAAILDVARWILEHHPQSTGIVYVLKVSSTLDYAAVLSKRLGREVLVYHGDLSRLEKEAVHRRWTEKEPCIIVATCAFGTGVNRGDVSFVVHASCPKSLFDYVQESGRAGRNGRKADCVLFWGATDIDFSVKLLLFDGQNGPAEESAKVLAQQQGHLAALVRFAESGRCRSQHIESYFGASAPMTCLERKSNLCDVCRDGRASLPLQDVSSDGLEALSFFQGCKKTGGTLSKGGLAVSEDNLFGRRVVAAILARGDIRPRSLTANSEGHVLYIAEPARSEHALPSLKLDPFLRRIEVQKPAHKKSDSSKSQRRRERRGIGMEELITYDGVDTPPRSESPLPSRPSKRRKVQVLNDPLPWSLSQRLSLFDTSDSEDSSGSLSDACRSPIEQTRRILRRASRLSIEPSPTLQVEVEIATSSSSRLDAGSAGKRRSRAFARQVIELSPSPAPQRRPVRASANAIRGFKPSDPIIIASSEEPEA